MTDEERKKIINRLKSIEGHVKGVTRMVEDDVYCLEIVNQIRAIQAALQKVNVLIINRHLYSCFTATVLSPDPDEREQMIDRIMGVLEVKGKIH